MNIYGSIAAFLAITVSVVALLTLTFGAMADDPDTLIDTTVGARYRAYPQSLTNPTAITCEANTIRPPQGMHMTWKVVEHIDADTITVTTMDGPEDEAMATIELWGMDAPEPGQPYAEMSLMALKQLIPAKSAIKVYPYHNDNYRYIIGSVATLDQSVQLLMIGNGWAFADMTDMQAAQNYCLNQFEEVAKSNKAGLWAYLPHAGQRPWQYRQQTTPP